MFNDVSRNIIESGRQLVPMIMVLKDGKIGMSGVPFETVEDKARLQVGVGIFVKDQNPDAVIFVSEGWVTKAPDSEIDAWIEEVKAAGGIHKLPYAERKEIAMYVVSFRGEPAVMLAATITRCESGKGILSKPEWQKVDHSNFTWRW